jgi:hypothetical protein
MSANARMRLNIDEMEPDYCHVTDIYRMRRVRRPILT